MMQAVRAVTKFKFEVVAQADATSSRYKDKLAEHHAYIREHGEDSHRSQNGKWT
jgi:hypothetical protein